MNDFIHSTMAICATQGQSFADVLFSLKECDQLPEDYNIDELRSMYALYVGQFNNVV
jgi:hypothetical protein